MPKAQRAKQPSDAWHGFWVLDEVNALIFAQLESSKSLKWAGCCCHGRCSPYSSVLVRFVTTTIPICLL